MLPPKLEYIHGLPPPNYSLAFEPFLYNQEAFLALKTYSVQSFYAVNHHRHSIEARIHFVIREQKDGSLRAISLPELPFGSLEYSNSLTEDQVSDFLSFVKEELVQQNVRSIEIRDCVSVYRIRILLEKLLPEKGYRVTEEMVNHTILLDRIPFVAKIHAMEKRKLKKCVQAGFTFQFEPLSELASVYQFISQCRSERGWNLSLSLNQLSSLVRQFPDNYFLFSVVDQDHHIAAATVAVQVDKFIFYNFYPASLTHYRSFSPLVYLLEQLYNYANERKFYSIDLGISTSPTLANFKSRVGGTLSYKKTYLLEW